MEEAHTQNNGGYDLEGVIWHQHSNKLMKEILAIWPNKKHAIVDLGCGHNFYISVLRYADYVFAEGIDAVDLGSLWAMQADITAPLLIKRGGILNWDGPCHVISLEVGEHIPEEKSGGYLDNVCSFDADVLMSWAIPGQAGHGHINCQQNEWVIKEMKKRGKEIDPLMTGYLRRAVEDCHCSWFKNTLMYFR